MSSEAAKAAVTKIIETVLQNNPAVRETLDNTIHILDLSFHTIEMANKPPVEAIQNQKFGRRNRPILTQDSYDVFVQVLENVVTRANTLQQAIDECQLPANFQSTSRYVSNGKTLLLVCRNFGIARSTISKISASPLLQDNDHFGKKLREYTWTEVSDEHGISNSKNIDEITGKKLLHKTYIFQNGTIWRVAKTHKKVLNKKTGEIIFPDRYGIKQVGRLAYTMVAVITTDKYEYSIFNNDGNPDYVTIGKVTYKLSPKEEYANAEVTTTGTNTLSFVNVRGKKYPIVRKTYLSVLDIGHAFQQSSRFGNTPLGQKFTKSLEYTSVSPEADRLIKESIKSLDNLHSAINYTIYNSTTTTKDGDVSVEKFLESTDKSYIILTIQNYRANNALAVFESKIRKELIDALTAEIIDIPGSKTIKQDIVSLVHNKILKILGIKSAPIKKHSPVTGSVKVLPPKTGFKTGGVSGPNKTVEQIKVPAISSTPMKLRTLGGQFTSLVSLQNLLNQNLHTQIQQNMGTGSRRDILNYRTGRFAESVKVEKMSQSREGMITAFYSYMRNPYATFSFGGQQSSPASRDPKLLISKSIREIGAAMVNNRMRAVLV
jgi:hypothetical protein